MSAPTTDLAIADPDQPLPRRMTLDEKIRYAQTLASAGLLPTAYRQQPANVLYAVEYGDMLGLSPLAAITGIHIIEGKPSASAGLIGALVRRAGHRLRVTGDDQSATAEIVRSDDPDFVFRATWTLDRARAAGLLSKGTWQKFPAAMLKARAISEVARDACEEALSGVHYTPEELGAMVDADGDPLTTIEVGDPQREADAAPGSSPLDIALVGVEASRTDEALREVWNRHAGALSVADRARFKAAVEDRKRSIEAGEVAPEPDGGAAEPGDDDGIVDAVVVEDTPDTDPEPDGPSGRPANRSELTQLGIRFGAVGLTPSKTDHPKIHAICSHVAGRPIKSRTELTGSEAAEVLALLREIEESEDPAETLQVILTAAQGGES